MPRRAAVVVDGRAKNPESLRCAIWPREPERLGDKRRSGMSAYVIVDIEVTDPEGYKEYVKLAPATVTLYGGEYLARGGSTQVLEGEWTPKRLVILRFESVEQARRWLDSPEYEPVRALRHKYARSNMVVIAGPGNSPGS
jgi:uncharacterized protein (DUF1330 family)